MFLNGESGWLPGPVRCDMEVLRLYNQVIKMPRGRLTRDILLYDRSCRGKGYPPGAQMHRTSVKQLV